MTKIHQNVNFLKHTSQLNFRNNFHLKKNMVKFQNTHQ